MNLYFLSGLGADYRVFANLTLPDEYNIIHIKWIEPLKNDTLQQYAFRLSKNIDLSKPFCLIGVSFGGIIATELSKIVYPKKTIIISSISTHHQMPWYFIIPRILKPYLFVPEKWIRSDNAITCRIFGIKSTEDRKLLKQILDDTDITFLNWAMTRLLNWKHDKAIPDLIHIHGTSDHIFPVRYIKPDISIDTGGHFMVFNKAAEICEILSQALSKAKG